MIIMKRREITLNRDFRLNTSGAFTLLAAGSTAVIIFITSAVMIISNRSIEGIIINQQMISETDAEILNTLLDLESKKNNGDIHLSTSVLLDDSETKKFLTDKNVTELIKIRSRNITLIIILTFSVIFQSVIIFYFAFKRSHGVSGPVFLSNGFIDELRNAGSTE